MSGPQPGFLATYNSLTDKHLVGYFSNARIRQHLQRSGLISRSGRIIPEKEYWLNAIRRDHQRYVEECLARAIFQKVLDMERRHQLEIKKKLENSMRKERVQKIKKVTTVEATTKAPYQGILDSDNFGTKPASCSEVEQSRRSVEGARPMRSPHPPLGPRSRYVHHPLVAVEPAGHSQLRAPGPVLDHNGGHPPHQHRYKEPAFSKMTSWRPNTAPGNMQHPLRLQPLHGCAAVGSVLKASSSKQKCHITENDQQLAGEGERSGLRLMNSVEYVPGISPYQLPAINNYAIPVPPPRLQKGDKTLNAVRSGMPRGRRFRPTTAPNDPEQLVTKGSAGFPKPTFCSNALVTMIFLGKSLHLSHNDAAYRDEIKIYQQHCGGENLCVYKGKLLEGETFQFVSKRHHGFPFSLTFFLNGIQVDRLSWCCEYKHQKHSRLGGRHGYFRFLNVEGAAPCYRCIIAMGLDKKPSPPKRKMEILEEKHVRDGVHSEPSKSNVEQKSSKGSVLVILPGHKASVEATEGKKETRQEYRKEERKILSDRESEDSQEDTGKNEYDEDFEADEAVNEEGQTDDQMSGMSKSSSDDKTHNLDYENESESSSQKALQASDSETDESDGYSDSGSEDDKQDRRPARSLSSVSTQYGSEDDSHAELVADDVKDNEDYRLQKASDDAAHAHSGNENEENKPLGKEENQETFALEKEEIDEAEKAKPEDLTAREDTAIFHENIMGIQHQSPEVNGKLKEAGSAGSSTGEDGEKNASTGRDDGEERLPVPLERSAVEMEDGNGESPQSAEAGAAPDGASLVGRTRTRGVQKAAEQVAREGQAAGERQALEEEDFVAEGGDARTQETGEDVARVGDLLPREETVAALQVEGQLAGDESGPAGNTMAEEDPKGKGTGKGMESGTEVAPGEQEALVAGTESEAALGEWAPRGEEPAGTLLSREAGGAESAGEEEAGEDSEGEEAAEASRAREALGATGPPVQQVVGATVSEAEEAVEEGGFAGKGVVVGAVSEGEEAVEEGGFAGKGVVAGAVSEGEEAVEEGGFAGKGVVADAVSEGEEAVEEGGFAGKGVVAGAVSEGEEAVEGASLAEEGVAGVVGPEGEESVEEAISEGEEAVEKPGALLETSGDTNVCTGEAMPGEDFVKPSEFSQLKASGEERMWMGKAALGAAASATGKASGGEGSSLPRAEGAVEEAAEPGRGPVLQVAPGLEALVDAGGGTLSEGSPQLEQNATAEREEGSAEALLSESPTLGSKAKTEGMEEGPDGEVMGGVSAETGSAESGAVEEEATGGAAGPGRLAAGVAGPPECAPGRGKGSPPGEAVVDEAAPPVPGLRVGRAGGPGVVAGAVVVGAQAGRGARAEGAAGQLALVGEAAGQEVAVAGDGRVGNGALAQEGVRGAVLGGQSGMGAAAAEGASAEGTGAAEESGRDREGAADGAAACGRGVNQETALGCEGRGPAPVGAEGQGEAQWGTAHFVGGEDGLQEGTGQAGVKAEQPGLRENERERESAWSAPGVREQRKDGPVGGSPGAPGAADAGERSRSPCEDVANPDANVVPSVQPQDGEETLL